jgi:hypothetical protein
MKPDKDTTAAPAVGTPLDCGVRRRRAELAMHRLKGLELSGGKIKERLEMREVEVLARAKGYAMVRRKGCAPYVVSEKDLAPAPNVAIKRLP